MRRTGGQNFVIGSTPGGKAAVRRSYEWSSPHEALGRVGGMAQGVVVVRPLPRLDARDLVADSEHRIAEAIDLGQAFALGRLDHEGARHGNDIVGAWKP